MPAGERDDAPVMRSPIRAVSRATASSQRGDVAAEQVALLTLVAAVIAALLAVNVPGVVFDWGRYAVCTLFGGDCPPPGEQVTAPDGGTAPDDGTDPPGEDEPNHEDFLPAPCMLLEESEQVGSQVSIFFIDIGEDWGFLRREFADGRVELTAMNGASIGASWDPDTRIVELGSLETDEVIGVDFEVGGTLSFTNGDTWTFADADEEARMRAQLDEYLAQQAVQDSMSRQGNGFGGWIAVETMGRVDPPRDPSKTYSTIDLDIALGGSAGLRTPISPGSDGQDRYADPNLGGYLGISGGGSVTVETDHDRGRSSYIYSVEGSAEGGVDLVAGGGGFTGTSKGTVKVTRDASGDIVQVELVTTREGGAEFGLGVENPAPDGPQGNIGGSRTETTATVTQTVLEVSTAEERAIVDAWLQGNNEQFAVPLRLAFAQAVPTEPVPGDPFQNLLYEQAAVSQVTYDNVTDARAFGASIDLGMKLGFSFHHTVGSRTASASDYLGAPVGAVRDFRADPGWCLG